MEPLKYPKLAELMDERLRQIRRQGRKARDVAKQADINETHLSMIRKGTRGLSQDGVVRLVRALNTDPATLDKDVVQFLSAAGHNPINLDPGRRPLFINPYTLAGFLGALSQLEKNDEIWFFSRGLPEELDPLFFESTVANLKKGVRYAYFLQRNNALDVLKLKERLRESGVDPKSCLELTAVVAPDLSFHYGDARFVQCVSYSKKHDIVKMYYTTREDDDYLYLEAGKIDASAFRKYLLDLLNRASENSDGGPPPIHVSQWLQERYNISVSVM